MEYRDQVETKLIHIWSFCHGQGQINQEGLGRDKIKKALQIIKTIIEDGIDEQKEINEQLILDNTGMRIKNNQIYESVEKLHTKIDQLAERLDRFV